MNRKSVVVYIVVFAIAGTVGSASAQTEDAIQDIRYLGDRWSVRLFGSLSAANSHFENVVETISYQYSFTNSQRTEAGVTADLAF